MDFTSLRFAAFFALVFVTHLLVPQRMRWLWLLAASVYFYGAFFPPMLLQVAAATAVGFVFGQWIEQATDPERKRRLLVISLVLIVGNLVVSKYLSFVNESFRTLFASLGLNYGVPEVHVLLAIGISFYTFQLVSYVVDVYRGQQAAERHFGHFALYVTFFPKVVAGPIERAKALLPQIREPSAITPDRCFAGLQLVAWGLFQKLVVADQAAPFVASVYDNPSAATGVTVVLATLAFAVQVYFDFNGYTDIARGTAEMLGYELSPNFRQPYFAASVNDFWKRWHISLTSWLTDYIYTPLTRSKAFKIKWYYQMLISLFLTFVVSGLWHGAEWTFVAWGALHGAYLVGAIMTQKWRRKVGKRLQVNKHKALHHVGQVAITFALVCFAYLFFEARSMAGALTLVAKLPTGWGSAPSAVMGYLHGRGPEALIVLFGAAIGFAVDYVKERGPLRPWLSLRPAWVRWGLATGLAVSIPLFANLYGGGREFIYFKF